MRPAAWTVIAIAAIELAAREVARASLLHAIAGGTPSHGWVAAVAVGTAAVLVILERGRRAAAPILAACFCAGLALQIHMGARLQSDGFYYFAYLRSLAFDRDVDFMNDYRMLGLGDKTWLFEPTRTGKAESAWTIGPAIVWAPFFGAGHVVATRLRAAGRDVAVDGTSFPYRQAVCVAGLFYGLLGCWFAWRFTRIYYPGRLAAAAVALTAAGSFMAWYFVKEPSMTHAPSMAAVAGFTWMWAATRDRRSLRSWALLGVLAGLMALIRWQNLLFALLPGLDALVLLARARGGDRRLLRETLAGSAVFLACTLAAFLPQMLAWQSIYGTLIARSPVGPQIRWTDPQLADILWSARNGLFSTTPILYLGAIGLAVFAFARPAVGVPAMAAVAVMIYFNACIQDWWGSAGFGGRRFDGTIPLFALGLAAFVDAAASLVKRHATAAVTLLLVLLAVWNFALMGAAQAGEVRIGETLSFDRAWRSQARFVHRWFGNPFTYPASLAFALRNGVSPGDYDLLRTNRFLSDPLRPYGAVDIGAPDPQDAGRAGDAWLLDEGWHAPERDASASFRWAASPATLRVPLDHAAPLRVQVRLHAFAYPGAPPQAVSIAANPQAADAPGTHVCGPLAVSPDWHVVECTIDRAGWRAGVNRLELRFAYAQRPADVGAGADPRPLAAAIDWVRVQVR